MMATGTIRAVVLAGVAALMPTTSALADLPSAIDQLELLVPGLSARVVCSHVYSSEYEDPLCELPLAGGGTSSFYIDALTKGDVQFDANGQWYLGGSETLSCPVGSGYQTSFYRVSSSDELEPVIRVLGECRSSSIVSADYAMRINPITGVAIIDGDLEERDGSFNWIAGITEVIEIQGFPTLLDTVLSYLPPSTLSFNVPVRPEGLAGADSFSVYSGDVDSVSDLSLATPLECVVPSGRAPVPGEVLSVPDTLSDPAIGHFRFYLAAVNHLGERRAGRTAINGVLSGRNAAALPGCP